MDLDVSTNLGFAMIQLRKVCNHPYLFAPKVDDLGMHNGEGKGGQKCMGDN
jgi:hypothetical protein